MYVWGKFVSDVTFRCHKIRIEPWHKIKSKYFSRGKVTYSKTDPEENSHAAISKQSSFIVPTYSCFTTYLLNYNQKYIKYTLLYGFLLNITQYINTNNQNNVILLDISFQGS